MKRIIMFACLVLTLTACGGSGGSSGGSTAPFGTTVAVATAAATAAIANSIDLDENPLTSISQSKTTSNKAINPLACTWLDENGNEIVADASNLDIVAVWICDDTCGSSGTIQYWIQNLSGTPFFTDTPFAGGLENLVTYNNCPITSYCGTNTLSGSIRIRARDLFTNPCNANITVSSSNNFVVDEYSSASLDLIMNFTSTGDCSNITSFDCNTVLDDSSTITVNDLYRKDEICEAITNETCL